MITCNYSLEFSLMITVYIILSFIYGIYSILRYIRSNPNIKIYKLFFIFLKNMIFMPISIIYILYLIDKNNFLNKYLKTNKKNILL